MRGLAVVGGRLITATQDGQMRRPTDSDPSLRLAWNEGGLLIAARVRDQAVVVDADRERLWRKDSMEVFFSAGRGRREHVQLTVAPPPAGGGTPPFSLTDKRGPTKRGLAANASVARRAGGIRTALQLEFSHVQARDTLSIEFRPRSEGKLSWRNAPIINGLEVKLE